MVVDFGSSGWEINGGDECGKSTAPITRDLLGGCCTVDVKGLDLDSHAPVGWEKRLDLKSGKIYLQRCNSPSNSSASTSESRREIRRSTARLLEEDAGSGLELTLSSPAAAPSPSCYQSVCTLEKVKSALERAEKVNGDVKKRKSSTSSCSTTSSSSVRCGASDPYETEVEKGEVKTSSFAAACPRCLLYVLVVSSGGVPRCPRCNSMVTPPPATVTVKKTKIDLNMSI